MKVWPVTGGAGIVEDAKDRVTVGVIEILPHCDKAAPSSAATSGRVDAVPEVEMVKKPPSLAPPEVISRPMMSLLIELSRLVTSTKPPLLRAATLRFWLPPVVEVLPEARNEEAELNVSVEVL
ncbi:hypothetical protein [Rhodophyticola sp.]|uniref:hypothetical protein n=1 Tax=Rhodophyticola sp. TaxID=2680032 RepID=UPI003D2AA8D1